jgi:hypothetical protein
VSAALSLSNSSCYSCLPEHVTRQAFFVRKRTGDFAAAKDLYFIFFFAAAKFSCLFIIAKLQFKKNYTARAKPYCRLIFSFRRCIF